MWGWPYLQFGVLWRLYQGLIGGRARVCRESLGRRVRLGWQWGLGPRLCTTGTVQKGLDRCEVQVDAVGWGLAQSICPRGSFLWRFRLRRRVGGLSLSPLPPALWRGRQTSLWSLPPCWGSQGPASWGSFY